MGTISTFISSAITCLSFFSADLLILLPRSHGSPFLFVRTSVCAGFAESSHSLGRVLP